MAEGEVGEMPVSDEAREHMKKMSQLVGGRLLGVPAKHTKGKKPKTKLQEYQAKRRKAALKRMRDRGIT